MQLSLSGYPGGVGNLAYPSGGAGASTNAHQGPGGGHAGGSNPHAQMQTHTAGMLQAPFQPTSPFSAWNNHAPPPPASLVAHTNAPSGAAAPRGTDLAHLDASSATGVAPGGPPGATSHIAHQAGGRRGPTAHQMQAGSTGRVDEGGGGHGPLSANGPAAKLDVDSIARKYGLQISGGESAPRQNPENVHGQPRPLASNATAGHGQLEKEVREHEALV